MQPLRTSGFLALAATLLLAAPASAGVVDRPLWIKHRNAYAAQGAARGVPVKCDPWNRVLSLRCEVGRGVALIMLVESRCVYTVSYDRDWLPAKRVAVNHCRPGWARTLPGPWATPGSPPGS